MARCQLRAHAWATPAEGDAALACGRCGRRITFRKMSREALTSIVADFGRQPSMTGAEAREFASTLRVAWAHRPESAPAE